MNRNSQLGMDFYRGFVHKVFLSLGITIVNLLVCGLPLTVSAQTFYPSIPRQLLKQKDKVPPQGLPGRRENGGTRRGGCLAGDAPVLALLLPPTHVGLTIAAYPRFFWYTPDNTAQKAMFSLFLVDKPQQQGALVYQTTFQPSSRAGVTSLSLPRSVKVPPLKVNQLYRWSVSLVCDLQDSSPQSVITVYGWIQRVAVSQDVTQQLQKLNPQERLSVYAERDLWFDQLATLANLRVCDPSNTTLVKTWSRLLQKLDLVQGEAIAQQPILQRCSRWQSRLIFDNN